MLHAKTIPQWSDTCQCTGICHCNHENHLLQAHCSKLVSIGMSMTSSVQVVPIGNTNCNQCTSEQAIQATIIPISKVPVVWRRLCPTWQLQLEDQKMIYRNSCYYNTLSTAYLAKHLTTIARNCLYWSEFTCCPEQELVSQECVKAYHSAKTALKNYSRQREMAICWFSNLYKVVSHSQTAGFQA